MLRKPGKIRGSVGKYGEVWEKHGEKKGKLWENIGTYGNIYGNICGKGMGDKLRDLVKHDGKMEVNNDSKYETSGVKHGLTQLKSST